METQSIKTKGGCPVRRPKESLNIQLARKWSGGEEIACTSYWGEWWNGRQKGKRRFGKEVEVQKRGQTTKKQKKEESGRKMGKKVLLYVYILNSA